MPARSSARNLAETGAQQERIRPKRCIIGFARAAALAPFEMRELRHGITAIPPHVAHFLRRRNPARALCWHLRTGLGAIRSLRSQPRQRNPNDQVLRCGSELTITPAPGTVDHPAAAAEDGLPASVQLDSGALLIEFHSKRRREFQILTPQAIASVRGTKWAMEVKPGQTSTLVLLGQVTVARKDAAEEVVVGPGQGVDVSNADAGKTVRSMSGSAKPAPIGVKKWAPDRVKALLARFGQ